MRGTLRVLCRRTTCLALSPALLFTSGKYADCALLSALIFFLVFLSLNKVPVAKPHLAKQYCVGSLSPPPTV